MKPIGRQTIFRKPLAAYPGEFQRLLKLSAPPVERRALTRWVSIGRRRNPVDLPPLDEAHMLSAWWARVMKVACPQWVRGLETKESVDVAPGEAGFPAMVERCRENEAQSGALYRELIQRARKASSPEESQRWLAAGDQAKEQWDRAVQRMREVEIAAQKLGEKAGTLWKSDEVLASFTALHLVLRTSIEAFGLRVFKMLNGKSDGERAEIWRSELNKVFAQLCASRFQSTSKP